VRSLKGQRGLHLDRCRLCEKERGRTPTATPRAPAYWYFRYEERDPAAGVVRYRREYVPKSELARVRRWIRRDRIANGACGLFCASRGGMSHEEAVCIPDRAPAGGIRVPILRCQIARIPGHARDHRIAP
jgi:hypothetical protein